MGYLAQREHELGNVQLVESQFMDDASPVILIPIPHHLRHLLIRGNNLLYWDEEA